MIIDQLSCKQKSKDFSDKVLMSTYNSTNFELNWPLLSLF